MSAVSNVVLSTFFGQYLTPFHQGIADVLNALLVIFTYSKIFLGPGCDILDGQIDFSREILS